MASVVIEKLSKIFHRRGHDAVGWEALFRRLGETAVHAVRDLNLAVADGELMVIMGPSGCGKTTTLRLVAGLEEPTAGVVKIGGSIVNEVPPGDRDVAMVFQNYALYPHLTGRQNMELGLKLRKVPPAEISRRVEEAAEILGIQCCLERRPAGLSGGERQRIALGRAMVRRPQVFLLDEPLSNLDAPMRAEMRREIAALHQRLGSTLIYVTHDQSEALSLGQRVAVMRNGSIQQLGRPGEIYSKPANLFVAGFVGFPPMNFFHGNVLKKDGALCFSEVVGEGAPFVLPLPADHVKALQGYCGSKKVILGIRPEQISPGAKKPGDVRATVEFVETMGPDTIAHMKTGSHRFCWRLPLGQTLPLSEAVELRFDLSHAIFFDPETEKAIEG